MNVNVLKVVVFSVGRLGKWNFSRKNGESVIEEFKRYCHLSVVFNNSDLFREGIESFVIKTY